MAEHDPVSRYIRLATVGNLNVAEVLAARLRAEGIDVRVHGASLGPYPVTVGGMAETDLWVPDDRVREASEVLLDAETNDVLEPIERRSPPSPPQLPIGLRLMALIVGVVLAALFLLRVIAVY